MDRVTERLETLIKKLGGTPPDGGGIVDYLDTLNECELSSGSGAITPENLPAGYGYVVKEASQVASNTITYDGTLEGYDAVEADSGIYMVKVSDAICVVEDLIGGTITMTDGVHTEGAELTSENVVDLSSQGFPVITIMEQYGWVVLEDGLKFPDGTTITKGIWLMNNERDGFYVGALTALTECFVTVAPAVVEKFDRRLLPDDLATKDEVEKKLDAAGDTMEGPLTLAGDPTNDLDASTKQYTDGKLDLDRYPCLPVDSWSALCYGAGKFVTAAHIGNTVHSEDGLNWTQATLTTEVTVPGYATKEFPCLCYGGGRFVAIPGTSIGNHDIIMAHSDDGVNWDLRMTSGLRSKSPRTICYGNDRFVMLTNDSSVHPYTIYSSPDGFEWHQYSGTTASIRNICYGNGKFLAMELSMRYPCRTSEDGIVWTEHELSVPDYNNSYVRLLIHGNDKFLACVGTGDAEPEVWYSDDGITWTETGLQISTDELLLCYGNGKFVALPWDSDTAAYSEDGVTWTETTLPLAGNWRMVCYGGDRFIAIDNGSTADGYNRVIYSTDGITWVEALGDAYVSEKSTDVSQMVAEAVEPYLGVDDKIEAAVSALEARIAKLEAANTVTE